MEKYSSMCKEKGEKLGSRPTLPLTICDFLAWKVKVAQSCPTLCDPMDYTTHGILQARILEWVPFPNTGVGSLSLLQGNLPNSGANSGLLHCRWIHFQLSHKGSPRRLQWVAYPFSSRSAQLRNLITVSCIAGRFLPS